MVADRFGDGFRGTFRRVAAYAAYIEEWFGHFPSKDETIAKILDGSAQQYSDTNIMHNDTKKLLEEIAGSI